MKESKANKITDERLKRYFSVTSRALAICKKSVKRGKKKQSAEIFSMVENYLSDARYFECKGDFVNAFAAINYAHGWIDCGVRLDVFDVDDDKLFTVK